MKFRLRQTLDLPLQDQLQAEANAWREAGLERKLVFPGEGVVDFTSSDYLGLARDERVVRAAKEAADEFGVGAPGARLLNGNYPVHEQAEVEAARWMGSEAALLFPSGWQANLALLTTFADRLDVLFCDSLNHASLIDAARLSRARVEVFAHNNLDALDAALALHPAARRRIVVVEDVYSMDGDRAPLQALLQLCQKRNAYLILDMAHAAGLYPVEGDMHPRLLARMFTGGKALGVAGGMVCASRLAIDALINHGRSFVFTTAVPPMIAAGLRRAMQIAQAEPEHAQTVFARADLLRTLFADAGMECPGESPIVPVMIGDSARSMAVAEKVREAGFEVRAVRPPTVLEGSSRLRIVVHAAHSEEQIRGLATAVLSALREERRRTLVEDTPPTPSATPLIVCGTDTDVGKTVVSALLVRASLRHHQATHYLKPVQTGMDSDTDTVQKLSGIDASEIVAPLVHFPHPASVDQAAEEAGEIVEMESVLLAAQKLFQGAPKAAWIVESAGGLLVPWNAKQDQADFLAALNAPVVLVARSGLGTLNHTLLTLEALAARRISVRALFLVGQPHPQNRASLERRLPYLPIFEVPWFKDLRTEHLDFWLNGEPQLHHLLQQLF
ncbi:MAG: dethiobiotin synthase [Planctomycetota bacterium]|nr:dethiobiotin synthase [Planctomycetota bacterium]MDA1114041.1 dethiobiotin synthase [Planctomycetota bacterium]